MRRLILLVLVIGLVACNETPVPSTTSVAAEPATTVPEESPVITPDRCDDLLAHFIDRALEVVTPWGLGGGGGYILAGGMRTGVTFAAAEADASGAAPVHSETNVQEAGVDEPDIVKTDGRHVYTLVDGALRVTAVDGTDLEVVHTTDAAAYTSMLLDGDRLVLFGSGWATATPFSDARSMPVWGSSTTTVLELDVSDPADPRPLRRLELDGSVVAARVIDGVVRMVTRSDPVGFEWATPQGSGLRAERVALEQNRTLIRQSTIEQWLPWSVLVDEATGEETEGVLVDCERVHLTETPAGLATVSIVGFPLGGGGLGEHRTTSLVADADTVYASSSGVYVAVGPRQDWGVFPAREAARRAEEAVTEIHHFAVDGADVAYTASGTVRGFLIGQWAMSEWDGHLRVASTTNPWGWWESDPSESELTVLAADDMRRVGGVGGMGPTETIRAVRFIGPVGYIVTFRQTDPLYVLDVSDPTAPAISGELKINGYSAYLHPVGDGLLLGVGQDATADGQIRGTQVSLFDVSDPVAPLRLDQITLRGGNSEVEWDHRGFAWWDGLALIPYQTWEWREGSSTADVGALAVRVDGRRLVDEGVLRNGVDGPVDTTARPAPSTVRRTVVIGDTVLTVGDTGIGIHTLDGLATTGYLPFG